MAKKCMYCGQLLAQEEAHSCEVCGRAQILPATSISRQMPIRVKFPPRELEPADFPASQRESSDPPQTPVIKRPSQQEQFTAQPSRSSERTVRPPVREYPAVGKVSDDAGSFSRAVPSSPIPARPRLSQTRPAEELSPMALPVWREGWEEWRKQQKISSSDALADQEPEQQEEAPGNDSHLDESTAELEEWVVPIEESPLQEMAVQETEEEGEEKEIEDLPTARLAVPDPAQLSSSKMIERSPTAVLNNRISPQAEEVEDQPTRPMTLHMDTQVSGDGTQNEVRPVFSSASPEISGRDSLSQPRDAVQTVKTASSPPMPQRSGVDSSSHPEHVFDPAAFPPLPRVPSSPVEDPLTGPQSQYSLSDPPTAIMPRTPVPAVPHTPSPISTMPSRAKRRVSGKLVLLVLILLIVGGTGGWLVFYQFSSGGTVNQPYQPFQNSAMGISFNYPQGWNVQIEQAQKSARFTDSSQTGQIALSIASSNGQQLNSYLNQQSMQLAIPTPHATSPVTFAGTVWQRVQADVTQKGVTWTIVLYVTQHSNRFYALTFQAPATVYAQMEQEDFAYLRTSFHFL